MPKISLTDLVDVVLKAGAPKATKVTQIKNRDDYHPATDFYKQFRDGIVAIHKAGGTKADLGALLKGVTEKNRLSNYPVAIAGYKKWWGKKNFEWFTPPVTIYSASGVEVSINPELGLKFNDDRYVIKLYLKSEKLTKNRADLIVGLMQETLGAKAAGARMAVVDVREGKLFEASSGRSVVPLIDAELAYIASLWPKV